MAKYPNDEQNVTKIVTSGSTIRFEQPKSGRSKKSKVSMIVSPEVHPVSGFVDFLRAHAVVSLAIAFVIGLQSQKLVTQLVSSFIDPLFQLLFGKALSQRTFTLHFHTQAANFGWGAFVYGLLDFLFVLAAIYAIVKFFSLESLDKPKQKKD